MIDITDTAHVGLRVANFKRLINAYENLEFGVRRDDQQEQVE